MRRQEFRQCPATLLDRVGPNRFIKTLTQSPPPRRPQHAARDHVVIVNEESVGVTIVNAQIEIRRDAASKSADAHKVVSLPSSDDQLGGGQAEYRLMGGDVGPCTRRPCLSAEMMFSQQDGRGHERPPRGI